jgi:hypothetical protein
MRVGDAPEAAGSVRAGRPFPRSQAPPRALTSKAALGRITVATAPVNWYLWERTTGVENNLG